MQEHKWRDGERMSAHEFAAALDLLGWSAKGAGEMFGVSARTVQRWRAGEKVVTPEATAVVRERLTKRGLALPE